MTALKNGRFFNPDFAHKHKHIITEFKLHFYLVAQELAKV
jgi:hypothetical protein